MRILPAVSFSYQTIFILFMILPFIKLYIHAFGLITIYQAAQGHLLDWPLDCDQSTCNIVASCSCSFCIKSLSSLHTSVKTIIHQPLIMFYYTMTQLFNFCMQMKLIVVINLQVCLVSYKFFNYICSEAREQTFFFVPQVVHSFLQWVGFLLQTIKCTKSTICPHKA